MLNEYLLDDGSKVQVIQSHLVGEHSASYIIVYYPTHLLLMTNIGSRFRDKLLVGFEKGTPIPYLLEPGDQSALIILYDAIDRIELFDDGKKVRLYYFNGREWKTAVIQVDNTTTFNALYATLTEQLGENFKESIARSSARNVLLRPFIAFFITAVILPYWWLAGVAEISFDWTLSPKSIIRFLIEWPLAVFDQKGLYLLSAAVVIAVLAWACLALIRRPKIRILRSNRLRDSNMTNTIAALYRRVVPTSSESFNTSQFLKYREALSQRWARRIIIAIGSFFLLIYLIMVGICVEEASDIKSAKDWPYVKGKIVKFESERQPDQLKRLNKYKVSFAYSVNGKDYGPTKLRPTYASKEQMQRYINQYYPDAPVKVYYNPKKPKKAVLHMLDSIDEGKYLSWAFGLSFFHLLWTLLLFVGIFHMAPFGSNLHPKVKGILVIVFSSPAIGIMATLLIMLNILP